LLLETLHELFKTVQILNIVSPVQEKLQDTQYYRFATAVLRQCIEMLVNQAEHLEVVESTFDTLVHEICIPIFLGAVKQQYNENCNSIVAVQENILQVVLFLIEKLDTTNSSWLNKLKLKMAQIMLHVKPSQGKHLRNNEEVEMASMQQIDGTKVDYKWAGLIVEAILKIASPTQDEEFFDDITKICMLSITNPDYVVSMKFSVMDIGNNC